MMKIVAILTVLALCEAYDDARLAFVRSPACSIPNWRCDCKITYACSSESFGVVEDLAPNDYPLRITGMRWRQKQSSQEEFCKDQCRGRMNAFLAPNDDGSFSEYSFAAICLDLLNVPGSPFLQNSGAPCCTMYLEYGRQWCEENWDVSLFTARCLQLGSPDFSGGAPAVTASHAFGIDGSCQPGSTDFNWCDTGTLACPAP